MCIIFFAYQMHAKYPFLLAANRDEYYNRPSAPAHFWPDTPAILAGRDLGQNGTWLGVTRSGRFAALTNYRDPAAYRSDALSRGHLVSRFLQENTEPLRYLEDVQTKVYAYNGFNLLAGDFHSGELWYYGNRENQIRKLPPGIYGLSNHLLDTPWPKVTRGKSFFTEAISAGDRQMTDLLWALLQDRTAGQDDQLPDTGVSREWERTLSPIHIHSPAYGTRAMTILRLQQNGVLQFDEQSFDEEKQNWTHVKFTLSLQL